jgi:hypothetical protein
MVVTCDRIALRIESWIEGLREREAERDVGRAIRSYSSQPKAVPRQEIDDHEQIPLQHRLLSVNAQITVRVAATFLGVLKNIAIEAAIEAVLTLI